jgi:hypothetical protein
MTRQKNWIWAGAMAASTLLPSIASADPAAIFTDDNYAELCTDTYRGLKIVNLDALANRITTNAGALPYLDGANSSGVKDGAIQMRSTNGRLSEPMYAVVNIDGATFGPRPEVSGNPNAVKARDDIRHSLTNQVSQVLQNGEIRGENYRYHIGEIATGVTPPSKSDRGHFLYLFQDPPHAAIFCEDISKPNPKPQRGSDPNDPRTSEISSGPDSDFKLRGTVKDLSVSTKSLSDAKAATFTAEKDGVADDKIFGINGVAAVSIYKDDDGWEILPFISYENRSSRSHQGDIEKVSPGLLLSHLYTTRNFGIQSRLEGSYLADKHQDSEQAKFRLYLDPSFSTKYGILFGSYLKTFGALQLRPDLTLIGDYSRVIDDGTNADLANAESYFGLGGELSVRTRLDMGRPISDFVLQAGIRELRLFGEIRENETRRLFGKLAYSPEDFPYLGVALSFEKGDNDDTFQEERVYGLRVEVRY